MFEAIVLLKPVLTFILLLPTFIFLTIMASWKPEPKERFKLMKRCAVAACVGFIVTLLVMVNFFWATATFFVYQIAAFGNWLAKRKPQQISVT